MIRIPIVDRSQNTVRSPINIRVQNTNRHRDKWCTTSDSRDKKALGGDDSRVKKTNFGA